MKKNKPTEKKPHSALNIVIILIVSNLIIYLYVIATGVKIIDLMPFNQSKINDYLIIGSYFILTFAMIITMATIFNVRAYVKRLKPNEPVEQLSKASAKLDDDGLATPSSVEAGVKVKSLINVPVKDDEDQKKSSADEDKMEKKLPGENIKVKMDDKINRDVPVGWKKIGIKLEDVENEKPEIIVPEDEQNEPSEEDSAEIDNSVVNDENEKIEEEILEAQYTSDSIDEAEEVELDTKEENIGDLDASVNVMDELKQDEQETYIDNAIINDSEVIKNLEEVKMMVDEMKIKLEQRRINKKQ